MKKMLYNFNYYEFIIPHPRLLPAGRRGWGGGGDLWLFAFFRGKILSMPAVRVKMAARWELFLGYEFCNAVDADGAFRHLVNEYICRVHILKSNSV